MNQPDPNQEKRDADQRAQAQFDNWTDIVTLIFVGGAAAGAIGAWFANRRSAHAAEQQVGILRDQIVEARQDAAEQRRIANEALAETRTSALAAQRSAAVATDMLRLTHLKERAYVEMSHLPPGIEMDAFSTASGADPIDKTLIRLTIGTKNYGSTRGVVTARLIQLLVLSGSLPSKPPYDETLVEVLRLPLLKDSQINRTFSWKIEDTILENARKQTSHLYVIGYVDYMDQFGGRHRAGYARVYDPWANQRNLIYKNQDGVVVEVKDPTGANNNLPVVPDMAYNYDSERKKGEGNDWDEAT